MAFIRDKSLTIPIKDAFVDSDRMMTTPWFRFFQLLKKIIDPIGLEDVANLDNNVTTSKILEGIDFNKAVSSQGMVEYLIQRITTGTGAVELVESGSLHVAYKPTSNSWVLQVINSGFPSNAGITFSITNDGQVKYTSTNITGTPSISRIAFRIRYLSAKHESYSKMGRY